MQEIEIERVETTYQDYEVLGSTTIIKTSHGWQRSTGKNVSDECVRELKQRILRNEVDAECPKPDIAGKEEEQELEKRDELQEKVDNLTEQLKEAYRRNETERQKNIKENLTDAKRELDILTGGRLCEYPGEQRYFVNITYTNSTKVTLRSTSELIGCGGDDYSWYTDEVDEDSIRSEMRIIPSDRITYLVKRLSG